MSNDQLLTPPTTTPGGGPITFAFVHGGGDVGWAFHRVEAALRERGHATVAIDLPIGDPTAGFQEYAAAVVAAIGEAPRVVVAGHSLGGMTAPLVASQLPAVGLVAFLAGMVPRPGETFSAWWTATGQGAAMTANAEALGIDTADDLAVYLHDVDPVLARDALSRSREQAGDRLDEPWPSDGWPATPTRYLLFRDDRLFPAEFVRRLVRDRLGYAPDEIDGSHMALLSQPVAIADWLEQAAAQAGV